MLASHYQPYAECAVPATRRWQATTPTAVRHLPAPPVARVRGEPGRAAGWLATWLPGSHAALSSRVAEGGPRAPQKHPQVWLTAWPRRGQVYRNRGCDRPPGRLVSIRVVAVLQPYSTGAASALRATRPARPGLAAQKHPLVEWLAATRPSVSKPRPGLSDPWAGLPPKAASCSDVVSRARSGDRPEHHARPRLAGCGGILPYGAAGSCYQPWG